jgi:hypothetical protein
VDTDPGLVRLEVFRRDEADVIRGNDGNIQLCGDIQGMLVVELLPVTADALQLDVVAIREERAPPLDAPFRVRGTIGSDHLTDVSGSARGESDEPVRVTLQPVVTEHGHAAYLTL